MMAELSTEVETSVVLPRQPVKASRGSVFGLINKSLREARVPQPKKRRTPLVTIATRAATATAAFGVNAIQW